MRYIKSYRIFIALLLLLSLIIFSFYDQTTAEEAAGTQTEETSTAEEIDCLSCHESLTNGTSIHPAISFGCTTCHTAVDASNLPHKITNRHPYGLSSKQKRLCYSCHEKSQFMKSNVHGALLLGCTSCHNPHSSEEAHLLKAGVPDLCMQCHDQSVVTAKAPHDSIGDTSCSTCHNAHATDGPKLLLTEKPAPDSTALVQSSGN